MQSLHTYVRTQNNSLLCMAIIIFHRSPGRYLAELIAALSALCSRFNFTDVSGGLGRIMDHKNRTACTVDQIVVGVCLFRAISPYGSKWIIAVHVRQMEGRRKLAVVDHSHQLFFLRHRRSSMLTFLLPSPHLRIRSICPSIHPVFLIKSMQIISPELSPNRSLSAANNWSNNVYVYHAWTTACRRTHTWRMHHERRMIGQGKYRSKCQLLFEGLLCPTELFSEPKLGRKKRSPILIFPFSKATFLSSESEKEFDSTHATCLGSAASPVKLQSLSLAVLLNSSTALATQMCSSR